MAQAEKASSLYAKIELFQQEGAFLASLSTFFWLHTLSLARAYKREAWGLTSHHK